MRDTARLKAVQREANGLGNIVKYRIVALNVSA
jgi:hypothetical protein